MPDIRCDNNGCNKLLARIVDGRIELYCPRCKTFHPVQIVDVVAQGIIDLRNGHKTDEEKPLLW